MGFCGLLMVQGVSPCPFPPPNRPKIRQTIKESLIIFFHDVLLCSLLVCDEKNKLCNYKNKLRDLSHKYGNFHVVMSMGSGNQFTPVGS